MQQLLETFDNPVNLSEWFSTKPLFHRVGGKGSRLTPQNKRRSKWGVNETILPNTHWNRLGITDSEQHLQDTLCATCPSKPWRRRMRHALCDSDPNRGLPSILCETDSSGNITGYYVYGLGLISKIEASNAYFYQYDGLGSTVAITDKTGNIKNKYAYDDFGNLATNSSETITNPFKYVGRYGVMVDLPDFLYMRARYYVPSVGRFTQHDPMGAINLYLYAKNNPIKRIDPLGNQSIVIDIERLMIIGVIIAIIYQIRQSGNKFPLPESYPGAGKGKRVSELLKCQPKAGGSYNPDPLPPKGWWAQLLGKVAELLGEFVD